MIYLKDKKDFQIEEPTVVTIGKFDGRHRGHQKLLKTMLKIKEEYGYKTAVFTFSIAPADLVQGKRHTVITTNLERKNNLGKMGMDYLVEYPFTQAASQMSAEDFVKNILVKQMNAKAIVVGTDCGFGYKRSGNAKLLEELSAVYGYQLVVIEKEKDDDRVISSTYVREELDKGEIEKANELLGEPYYIHGQVVHGNHIGQPVLGYPTANLLPPPEKHLPPFGVYVSRVLIDGRFYGGITNIGRKPTIPAKNGTTPVGVETFVFSYEGNLYGKEIEVGLLHYVRPERKMSGLEELKAQITKDKEFGRRYLAEHPWFLEENQQAFGA
ncbi:MAG TPA: bifunctional riboflavin kinase/FAD synthetase [Candidatus Cottocaccamicrobium excrementipullorum]|nr:bifunctional riboflavin kinase/FAD synthetase [Candidatus Cottocaccamicrobium excrementipullorum]